MFAAILILVLVSALVAWNSAKASAPTDDDNVVIWRRISTGGNVQIVFQPAYDRYRVISRGVDGKVEWAKNCEPVSAGRFAFPRYVPGLGTRAICIEPLK